MRVLIAERDTVAHVDRDGSARMTIHQTFNRNRFDGDGGVPLNIIDLPSYKPELRFSCRRIGSWLRIRRRISCSTRRFPRNGPFETRSSVNAPAIATS